MGYEGSHFRRPPAHAVPVLPVMHGFVDLQMPTSVKLDDHIRLAFCNNGFRRHRHVTDTSRGAREYCASEALRKHAMCD